MKKLLAVLLALILTLSLCACGGGESSDKGSSVDGSVSDKNSDSANNASIDQAMTILLPLERIDYANGEVSMTHTFTYDSNDNLTQYKQQSGDPQYGYTYDYTVDQKGNRISEIYNSNDGNASEETFIYKNGILTESTAVTEDNTSYHYAYTCNKEGMITQKDIFEDGEKTILEKHEYDKNLLETLYAAYSDGTEDFRYEYVYDDSGELLKDSYYDDGSLVYRIEYTLTSSVTYDKDGNETGRTVRKTTETDDSFTAIETDQDGNEVSKIVTKWDKNKTPTEIILYINGNIYSSTKYKAVTVSRDRAVTILRNNEEAYVYLAK